MRSDADKTLESVKEVNDFPFYTATYHGNYRIDEYRRGAIDSQQAVIPFFEELFKDIGSPVSLSLPKSEAGQTGCSGFYCRTGTGGALLGKNLDWKRDPILLLKTRPDKGFGSLSMVNLNFCDLFNTGSFKFKLLLSPYVPLDGMNENGLVVSMLSVSQGAEYPFVPGRISVGDFNIIRIALDFCGSVDEAVETFEKYNLMQTGPLPLHYLIADEKKSCIVEYSNGEMRINENEQMNYLTNFNTLNNPDYDNEKRNCHRYQRIEKTLSENDNTLSSQAAMRLLNDVSVFQPDSGIPSTMWSIVYDIGRKKMKIRTGKIPVQYSVGLGSDS